MFGYKLLLCVIVVLQISFIKALKIPKDYKCIKCKLAPVKRPYKKRLHIKNGMGNSNNWSGYAAVTNLSNPSINSVSYVEGWWRVPKISATSNNAYSSAWVGIDGFTSFTVEQLGTENDWVNGQQYNYAWFEMYPASENRTGLYGFPVNAGDLMAASVKYTSNGVFVLTIANHTQKAYYIVPTKYTKSLFAQRSSAEWIIEAPFAGSILPLANFGTIYFYNCTCTIEGTLGAINNPKWQNDNITMITGNGGIKALTSGLTCGGKNFSVTWKHQ